MISDINIPDINEFRSVVKVREKYVKEHFPDLYNEILSKGCDGKTFSEKLYQYYHGITTAPVCKFCKQNKTKYRTLFTGYAKYCCNECNARDPERVESARQTNLNHSDEEKERIRKKINQTNFDRYGGIGFASPQLMQKTIQTNIDRYGVKYIAQSPEIRKKIYDTVSKKSDIEKKEITEKIKHTNLERYGGIGASSEIISNKIKKTKLERYGNEYYLNQEKAKQTNLERYGVDNPMKSIEFQKKAIQTNLKKYGVKYPMLNQSSLLKNQDARKKYYIEKHGLIGITDDWDWICPCPHQGCNKCVDKYYIISSQRYYARKQANIEPCTNLLKISPNTDTYIETFVRSILDLYNIKYICNDRQILNGKEIDIYIPDKKIGIECNGVYWHSRYESNYHENKWRLCSDLNIQLLTIWEDQIKTDPDKIISIIKSKLGIYDERIYARCCHIKDVSPSECTKFLRENHLQGTTKTVVRKGLYYKEKLVAVMTFSKPSYTSGAQCQNNGWVLSRFCTTLNTQVIGGAARLLKAFIKEYHPNKIISFASNDISNGNLYKILGFSKTTETSSYWYINKKTLVRYHRTSFTKTRLKQMGFNTDQTEEEIMYNTQEYYKIYDSGHTKYVLNLQLQ